MILPKILLQGIFLCGVLCWNEGDRRFSEKGCGWIRAAVLLSMDECWDGFILYDLGLGDYQRYV